ncbi:MAG TPA: class I SAM-dependent methyltransferase [Methylomirabilota bacterium]|nr:class I SAM-dependent methyltransferase [Methylomirabilota bacterium]
MTKTATRMLRLMDRAVTLWRIPVIGKEKSRVLRRLLLRHQPRRGIEVGSLFGYSAILVAGHMPRGGRLVCVEQNAYLAKFVASNVEKAGLARHVRVVVGDALRVLPLLRGPVDFLLIDANKEDYLDYLRAVESRLVKGALVVADNTGMYRRDVKPYLDHVRNDPRYESREHDFGFDCMEVSVFRG